MNTLTRTTRPAVITALSAETVTTTPVLIVRGPDFYEDGMAVWIGPRAAVSVDMDRDTEIQAILAMPRMRDIPGGWSRIPAEQYGVHVQLFEEGDDAPTAQDSWGLLTEAVSL